MKGEIEERKKMKGEIEERKKMKGEIEERKKMKGEIEERKKMKKDKDERVTKIDTRKSEKLKRDHEGLLLPHLVLKRKKWELGFEMRTLELGDGGWMNDKGKESEFTEREREREWETRVWNWVSFIHPVCVYHVSGWVIGNNHPHDDDDDDRKWES